MAVIVAMVAILKTLKTPQNLARLGKFSNYKKGADNTNVINFAGGGWATEDGRPYLTAACLSADRSGGWGRIL